MEPPLTEHQFWTATWILLNSYQSIHKRIFASVIENIYKITSDISEVYDLEKLQKEQLTSCTKEELQMAVERNNNNEVCEGFLVKQKMLHKKRSLDISAYSIVDFTKQSYTLKFMDNSLDDFTIEFCNGKLKCIQLTTRQAQAKEHRLMDVLVPKFIKWAQGVSSEATEPKKPTLKSLQLIDMKAYNDLYKQMKLKYATTLKQYWIDAKESTDPLKFIYEELAIAAYLISLWRALPQPPSGFADLGCGNGLLVHVLIEEGYHGYGYDIRKRKLWTHYPTRTQTQLIEEAVMPLQFQLPSEVDWLIGNHSDELSAWLPVMAAVQNYRANYFLLPCCAYEFSGAKFQRRNSKLSGYQDFCAYLVNLSPRCGFQTQQDRLKIPSTKRIAIIGLNRTHTIDEYDLKRTALLTYVTDEMARFPHNGEAADAVKLRATRTAANNCTQIDTEIITMFVNKIFQRLLEAPPIGDEEAPVVKDAAVWRRGGKLKIGHIARLFTSEELKHIKAECGGIKTLMKNKHAIFQMYPADYVGLRMPVKRLNSGKKYTASQRPCYFQAHHPDGCPLTADDCTFRH